MSLIGHIFVFSIFIVFSIIVFRFLTECPQCKREGALKKTGVKGQAESTLTGKEEWKCKYCGHLEWQEEPTGCGGG